MGSSQKFATTRWSLVVAAGGQPTVETRAALATLCGLYWYPLYAFVRRGGLGADDASDLTQAFFAQLLERNDLGQVDPQRGKFRSWLLACLKHFQANERVRAHAQKRGAGRADFSIDATDAEGRYLLEPSHDLTAEKLYERRWTLSLLERAYALLKSECAQEGARKLALFEALKGTLMGEGDVPYSHVAEQLSMSEGAVKVAAHRLQKRHRVLVRAEIADTVERPEDIAEEIRGLLANLD